ncbi:MAG: hypothetical protein GY866_40650, partial [Proteobacteria bacterium]|nr:hypothetical protein [Pseudomonadota bacterium]
GAFFFISRGKLVFKTKEDLLKESDIATYEYRNKGARYQIANPKLHDGNYVQEEQKKRYVGWHIEDGLVESTVDTEFPPKMVSVDEVGKLDNLSKMPVQAVDFRALGEGSLTVGSPLKLVWHTGIAERPLDESYPERVLIGGLEHHEERNFLTRVNGVV